MLESLGARLRQQREQHGIDLVAIAEQTKIKRSLLEGLERDDVSGWPSGIFRRAYVRTYAQAVGLDPDTVLQQFLQAHPEPADVAALAEIASLADGARANGSGSRIRDIMGSALGSFALFRRASAADLPVTGEPAPGAGPADAFRTSAGNAPVMPAATEMSRRVLEIAAEDAPVEVISDTAAEPEASEQDPRRVSEVPRPDIDLLAVAHLCTEFGRVRNSPDAQRLLAESARVLEANGLIVWIWDEAAAGLRPALACGYPERLLAQIPAVPRNADNATAEAFRAAETCVISGDGQASGALVVPLLDANGCAGVLALEFRQGGEGSAATRAVATILAASLTQLVGRSRPAETPPGDASAGIIKEVPPPILRTGTRR